MPNQGNFLDEAYGVYSRTTNPIEEERNIYERLGRGLKLYFFIIIFKAYIIRNNLNPFYSDYHLNMQYTYY
jgi:hypothetical protein